MKKDVWLSRRALKLHAVILVVVPAFMALCIWQIDRALSGNSLSWAYVFEWPLFAAYAVYMWWRFLHEKPETPAAPSGENGHVPAAAEPVEKSEQEDTELAAYNEYLAQLAERDQAAGR